MSGLKMDVRPDDIYVWDFVDFKRDTTDEWICALRQVMDEYDTRNEHLRCLAYFSESALPTPYATSQAISMLRDRPKSLSISVAMLSENSLIFGVVRFAMQQAQRVDFIRLCKTKEDALTWLEERHTLFETKGKV